jgi:hypothetical protein
LWGFEGFESLCLFFLWGLYWSLGLFDFEMGSRECWWDLERVNGVWGVLLCVVGVCGMLVSRVREFCEGCGILAGKLVILVEGGGLIWGFLAWSFLFNVLLGPGWKYLSSIEIEPGNRLELGVVRVQVSMEVSGWVRW